MAGLVAALVASDGFKLPLQGVEVLFDAAGEVEQFAKGVLLSQGLSGKRGYEQMIALGKVAISSRGPIKLAFLIRYFKLLCEYAAPMPVYNEAQICLLTKQIFGEIPTALSSQLGEMLLKSTVTGLVRLIRIVQNLDSLKALKTAIEGKLVLLGEEVMLGLSSEDSTFLASDTGGDSLQWVTERSKHISEIIQKETKANRQTLLSPLLLIAVRFSNYTANLIPLIGHLFPVDQFASLSVFTPERPASSQLTASTKATKSISMLAGLKWLYGKVMEEAELGLKSDFDQVQYELNRLISGDSIRIVKSGKQDLFEAFDALMVSGTITRESLSCWKVLIKSFGRLQVLETVEWRALQDKLTRLADRNQYLRDIGKKKPNRPKREPATFKADRKQASHEKRGLRPSHS